MFKRRIHLDYASITPIDPRVIREMKKFSADKYGNPSAWYKEGVAARNALEESKKSVASFMNAHPDEIVFTGGGTESNNLAIEGAYRAFIAREAWRGPRKVSSENIEKPHLIISSIEHSSVIEIAARLERLGCEVTRLGVDKEGLISTDELKKSIKSSTFMVSIMTVNNEIGTIQPIREIAKVIRHARKELEISRKEQGGRSKEEGASRKEDSLLHPIPYTLYPLFHTDAAQAVIHCDLNVEKLGVDLMTLDASKVYGPRGVGLLYIKRNTPIEPIILGGGQESGMRSGTENLPSIAGFAKALRLIQDSENIFFRDYMISGLSKISPNIKVNGPVDSKFVSPHILNVSIPGIDNEFFVLQLDARGIACSTKSSCLRDLTESYVLKAIGAGSGESVRFSFGRWTKRRDIEKALKIIEKVLR